MRRLISVFVLLATFNTSCTAASQWWERFKSDPIAGVQDGTNLFRGAVNAARVAFNLYALVNPTSAEQARGSFEGILGNVERGVTVAQSGLRVLAEARRDEVDTDALFTEARTAATSLRDFLRNLPGSGAGGAAGPSMAEAIAQANSAANFHPLR
jgi:hypothetical protein